MFKQIRSYLNAIENMGFSKGSLFLLRKKLKTNKSITFSNLPHPIHLRPGTSDDMVFTQIFVRKEYDIDMGFEPKIIIDGGANIGLASVYFKNRYKNAKIIAVEPDLENVEQLKLNTGKYDNIFIKQVGIWSKKMKSKLTDKYESGKWALVIEETGQTANEQEQSEIDTVTISDIMDEYKIDYIDLLKLDIETAEKEVFSKNYMSWLPKTKVIFIELHDWITPGCSKPFFTAINNAFANYSFKQVGENTVIINRDLVKE